jgi:hypothetical protein
MRTIILLIYCNIIFSQCNILQYSCATIQYITIYVNANTIYCNIFQRQYNTLQYSLASIQYIVLSWRRQQFLPTYFPYATPLLGEFSVSLSTLGGQSASRLLRQLAISSYFRPPCDWPSSTAAMPLIIASFTSFCVFPHLSQFHICCRKAPVLLPILYLSLSNSPALCGQQHEMRRPRNVCDEHVMKSLVYLYWASCCALSSYHRTDYYYLYSMVRLTIWWTVVKIHHGQIASSLCKYVQ